jgi:xylulokinase
MMFLGLDLGTTNVKALVTDRAGRPLAHAASPVELFHVGVGGVEQDIEAIEQATLAAMRQVAHSVDPAGIEAIGVASQGGAMQVLDAHARPSGRVISWLDQRGRPFDDAVTAELGREWFLRRIGRGCSGLSIGQLLRLRQEDPGLLRAPNHVGFVGDIVVSRLCGRAAHDGTSCSLTLLFNPRLRHYDPDLLQRLRLDASQLPDLISPREMAGVLRPDVAHETGLRAGVPVSAAIHDQYASALGTGAVRAGTVMVGTGTAWVLLAVNDRLTAPVIDEAFVCHHVVEGLCGQILSLVNGGSSFTWALTLMGLGEQDAAAVEALLESTQPGSAGLSFWPFLVSAGVSGLAPGTKGRLSGLQLSHRPGDVVRAVVEGLAFELNRYLDFLRSDGWPVARLVMGGGAASSQVTTQILADATSLPLACLGTGEASLLGAAILARGLVETESSLADLSAAMVPPARRVEPGAQAPFYREQYEEYLRALPRRGARQS